MAMSIQLFSAFILFCVSITNASYSSLAHWITTSDYLESKMFKDLTPNNNDPIKSSAGDGSITSGVTCASFKTTGTNTFYGIVAGFDETSTIELGISVWMYIPNTDYVSPLIIGNSITSRSYDISLASYGNYFNGPSSGKLFSLPYDKWVFVALYFVKINDMWNGYAISPGLNTADMTSSKFPGKYIIIGDSVSAYYYEIQAFKKAEMSNSVVTLSDSNGVTYIATTVTCPATCSSGGYCHPEIGCLSKTDCYCPSLCNCLADSSLCNSCKDSTYGTATKCKCKTGFIINAGSCVFGNFYSDGPLHCVAGSKTVCTQCESNFFLYDNNTSTICLGNFYLGCDSCTTCNASPNCYECVNFVVQDGSTCRVDSIGYQISFSSPNIVIDFAHSLPKDLKMNKFSAKTENNQDISTTSWTISPLSTSKQYQIVTNLTESQLPINLDFTFEQVS